MRITQHLPALPEALALQRQRAAGARASVSGEAEASPQPPADVAAWFEAQSLPVRYAAALGCAALTDLALLTEEDLREVGMKAAERRRLLAAAHAGPALG